MQLYKPGIAWPNADNNPWPIMEEASDEGEYYYKEDVHDQLTQLRGNLSLAEEGLANAMHDIEQLTAAASAEATENERLLVAQVAFINANKSLADKTMEDYEEIERLRALLREWQCDVGGASERLERDTLAAINGVPQPAPHAAPCDKP